MTARVRPPTSPHRPAARRAARRDPAALVDAGAREHYEDAALYDFEYRRRRDDVAFYRRLARERLGDAGAVLELACGSGRLTQALCRDGHRVLGFDLSEPMLRQARARLARPLGRGLVFRGDLRRFAVAGRFPLAIAAFNALEHLYTRVELAACLERVRDHLSPDGWFAFDVQVPHLAWLLRDPRRRWAKTRFRHPESGARIEYSTNHEYDPISQIALIRLYYREDGRAERVVHLSQRKYYPAELEALIHASGFSVVRRHGDFGGRALGPEALSQVLICTPR